MSRVSAVTFLLKGGGHCYEDFVINDTVKAIIDISPMNGFSDDASKRLKVGAGATNWELYKYMSKLGLCMPAGSCYSVGLGGHICGGGYGLLSRLYGLTVDHLTGVGVVTVDANDKPTYKEYFNDSASQADKDAFWAHTGGNFGVITDYFFGDNGANHSLPVSPEKAIIGSIAFNWSDLKNDFTKFKALLTEYAQVVQDEPEEFFGLFKLFHVSVGQIVLGYQYVTSDNLGTVGNNLSLADIRARDTALRRRFNSIATVVETTVPIIGHPGWIGDPKAIGTGTSNVYTFYEALQINNGSGANQRGKYKSAYMRTAFPTAQAQALFNWLTDETTITDQNLTKQTLVQVDSYGKAINNKSSTDTVIPQRDSIMKLQYQTYWSQEDTDVGAPDSTEGLSLVNWMNSAYANIYATTGGVPDPAHAGATGVVDGCYYNYPDSELVKSPRTVEDAMKLYFKDNYKANTRNLSTIKGQLDPKNYFNHSQSIPMP